MADGVSIVICTHNGARSISNVLGGIAANSVEVPVEILIVDNASADGVADEARRYWQNLQHRFSLRIFDEPRLGKSFAFFTGVFQAKFDIVVMCDDDNVLAPDYLATAIGIMDDQSIGAVGGAGALKTDGIPPAHFFNFAPWFAIGAQIKTAEEATLTFFDITQSYYDMVLWGAGLVLRRSDLLALMQVKGFPILNGQTKGEDNELCHAIALMGKRLIYTPLLNFEHLIHSERLAASRIDRRSMYSQESAPVLRCYIELRRIASESTWKTITHFPWRALRALLVGTVVRPLYFGILTKLKVSPLMNSAEYQIHEIAVQLRRIAVSGNAAKNSFLMEYTSFGCFGAHQNFTKLAARDDAGRPSSGVET